ncbi:hypothetical protein [Streptomyces sp. NPDC091212]
MTRQVDREHPVPPGEERRHRGPVGERAARAVQEDERRAVAAMVMGMEK